MKRLAFLLIPAFVSGEGLKSLIELSIANNQAISAKELTRQSKQKEAQAQRSAYYPTVDIGAFYQSVDERNLMTPGDVYGGFAKVGFDVYDGGAKSSLLKQKEDELKASSYDLSELKKNVSLGITQNFFGVKSLESALVSREEAGCSLKAQLERISAFYAADLATKDDVDRLKSAFDTNAYEMESLKLQILSLKLNLSLQVGKRVVSLNESSFKEELGEELELIDGVKSLQQAKSALINLSRSLESVYYPSVRLEDTYTVYGYGNTDAFHPEGVDRQNKLVLSANFRLYDNSRVSNSQQAIEIKAMALSKLIEYKTAEQKTLHELAVARVYANKIKIKSASSALASASSAFNTIEKKYTAGIVDNVAYLDALASRTNASSLYEASLNELQASYGLYYHYAGKKIEEFLNE